VPARLPEGARRRLEAGSDPIGRVLVDEGLAPLRLPALGRVPLPCPETVDPEVAEAVVWRRAYRLALGGQPVFAIREWFLRSVLDALATSTRRLAVEPSRSSPS
jgi:chorismate-pyruvate lyase